MKRIALIIGGASGIGKASAIALADAGYVLAVADLPQSSAGETVSALSGVGHRCYTVNVSEERSIQSLFVDVEEQLGPVAVLANFAAIGGFVNGKRPTLRETTLDSWNHVFATNSSGSFICLREMFHRRSLHRIENARAILIASMAAQDGGKNSPAAYVASKGAILALTKAAMGEAASLGITVNCIAPGAIDTPLLRSILPADKHRAAFESTPLGRPGLPAEVAAVVVFLASEQSAFITGACIDVNGGVRMS